MDNDTCELTLEQLDNVIGGQSDERFEAYRADLINEYNLYQKDYGKQPTQRGTGVPVLRQQRGSNYMRRLRMYILYLLRGLR